MRFTVTCHGADPLNLRETLERFANEQWLPAHVTREEAAAIVVDQFKRTIAQTSPSGPAQPQPQYSGLPADVRTRFARFGGTFSLLISLDPVSFTPVAL